MMMVVGGGRGIVKGHLDRREGLLTFVDIGGWVPRG